MKLRISYIAVFLVIVLAKAVAASTGPPLLLLAARKEIRAIEILSGNQTSLVDSLMKVLHVDYDYEDEQIFFNEISQDKILLISNISARSNFSSAKSPEVIVNNANIAMAIAYDWVHNNVYWTGELRGTIELLTMKGKHRLTIVDTNLQESRAIAVDPRDDHRWVYWTDRGRKPRIEKAGLDGSHRTLVVATNIGHPEDLIVDFAGNSLYWTDSELDSISFCDLNGQNIRVVFADAKFTGLPFSIDILGAMVYWGDWETHGIYEVDRNNSSVNVRTVRHTLRSPLGLRMYHQTRQPKGSDPCGVNNGGCSHICLAAPAIGPSKKKISCLCPDTGC